MPTLLHLNSLAELRSQATAWDDLWWRSEVTLPTARAELLALWVERFAPHAAFHALVVEDQGRWLAALPLVRKKIAGVFEVDALPAGVWSPGGELLWDATNGADEQVATTLVEAIRQLPCQLLWFEDIAAQQIGWRALMASVAKAGMSWDCRPHGRVPRIEIEHEWETYRSNWSRKHRQHMSACLRRLAARGEVRLRLLSRLRPGAIEPWLRRGFLVEDRSWKGPGGTSVLRTPGMFDFFLLQARQAAQWGQLELALLECGGRFVAFAYGLAAKGVFHSSKVGYDPAYGDCSPGQLLRYHLLERFHADFDRRAVDFLGILTAAHAAWRPEVYTVSRLILAPRGCLGRAALGLYRHLKGAGCGLDAVRVERNSFRLAGESKATE